MIKIFATFLVLFFPIVSSAMDEADSVLGLVADSMAGHLNGPGIVYPIKSGENETNETARALTEKLIIELQKRKISIVDRANAQRALNELAFSQSGATNKEIEAGKMAAAEWFMSGKTAETMGRTLIYIQLTSVQSGLLLKSIQYTLSNSSINDLKSFLLQEPASISAYAIRSAVFPGWGQFYSKRPVRGTVFSALVLGGIGATVFGWVKKSESYDEYLKFLRMREFDTEGYSSWKKDHGFESNDPAAYIAFDGAIKEKKNEFEAVQNRAILTTIITGVVWGLNIADAAIIGKKSKKRISLYYSAAQPYSSGIVLYANF